MLTSAGGQHRTITSHQQNHLEEIIITSGGFVFHGVVTLTSIILCGAYCVGLL